MTRDGGPKGRFGTCVDQSGFAGAIVTTGLIDPIVTTRSIERGSQGWEENVVAKTNDIGRNLTHKIALYTAKATGNSTFRPGIRSR
jgi:hypothetical protein